MNLARIEMMALFTELAKRVRRFTIEEEKRILNNVLRGFTTCVSPSADTTARSKRSTRALGQRCLVGGAEPVLTHRR